ncbi:MAG TPA: VWA domain-containing protein, partial [Edaphobacter sp.]|nr:VWA domain-containing protein [Edaphobacter sp.]
LFSTDVVEITDLLRTRHLPEALRRLSQRAAGWSGGTKIGESLRQFNQLYGRKLLSSDAVFMILSDGWDTGEPKVLAGQLRTVRRRAQRILWLNPLLGLKEYQPITRGMAAALPYVDVFVPAHNLESLLALERHL